MKEMMYDIASLLQTYKQDKRLEWLFFWGHQPSRDGRIAKSCLSQWWECKFEIQGHVYHTAEQYMMAEKATLFQDEITRQEILKVSNPKEMKMLGKRVRNFDENKWKEHRVEIVKRGNMAKFSQNAELLNFLLQTENKVLVEASPYDQVWGIGLQGTDKEAQNPNTWNGLNLLGFTLMEVRDELRGMG